MEDSDDEDVVADSKQPVVRSSFANKRKQVHHEQVDAKERYEEGDKGKPVMLRRSTVHDASTTYSYKMRHRKSVLGPRRLILD